MINDMRINHVIIYILVANVISATCILISVCKKLVIKAVISL
jgi:hypothetical protein